MPNTRLETFVFETYDIKRYVSLQSQANIKFQSEILDFGNYYFIQTMPSKFTGNSLGFIEWKGERGVYSSPESRSIDWNMQTSRSLCQPSISAIFAGWTTPPPGSGLRIAILPYWSSCGSPTTILISPFM